MAQPALARGLAGLRRIAQRDRQQDPARDHLQLVVGPALGLLDPRALLGVGREQRRIRMALVQEARDPVVGRDPIAVGGERRHGAEVIADAQRERAARAGPARLAAGVESVQPDGERMQQRGHLDASVGQLLVLEHQHRRAAGV